MAGPLDEIRAKIDLAEIVSGYLRLQRAGKNLKGLCPFHNEKTPSFFVIPDLNRFKCFGCGESGDAFAFLMRMEGIGFADAARRLAAKAGVQLADNAFEKSATERSRLAGLQRAVQFANYYFRNSLAQSETARAYLQNRGIDEATIEKFQIGFAPDSWDGLLNYLKRNEVRLEEAEHAGVIDSGQRGLYDKFRNRIMFPIWDATGQPIAFGGRALGDGEPKYLNSPESPLFEKRKTLYGLHLARSAIFKSRSVIVVEGYVDLIALHQAGVENAVATLGTALTEEHAQRFQRLQVERVYLAYDADEAGSRATERAFELLNATNLATYVVALPAGQDPDGLYRSEGSNRMQRLIKEAERYPSYAIKALAAKADLRSDDGRARLIAAALPVLAQVRSNSERDAYVEQLAPYAPTFKINPKAAADSLRQDLAAYIRSQRKGAKPASAEAPTRRVATAFGPAILKSEQTILAAALLPSTRSKAWSIMASALFHSPENARLARLLLDQWPTPPSYSLSDMLAELQDEPARHALADIVSQAVVFTEPSETELKDCAAYLRKKTAKSKAAVLLRTIAESERKDEAWSEFIELTKKVE
ncbi:MAG: DNA primase [Armatimonadetes bacterium]|nr:DNA primase [Armatimonadota bacterium]